VLSGTEDGCELFLKEDTIMRFKGQRIVVIGGSSGMGFATAKMAAEEGAAVVIAGRSEERLQKAKALMQGSVEIFTVNVVDEGSVKAFFDKTGEFDHLITPGNEAAMGRFLEMDTKTARAAFDSKFWGQYHAAKYGAPKMRGGGSITFFAGIWSQRPVPGGSVITAINSAIEGLGRALAGELAPIRVNTVSPGIVDTPIYSKMAPEAKEAMFKEAAASIPAKRVGAPEEIAKTVLYLMSNGYATGSTLYVDGGATLR
jgi:NAD(P)-dependent dehydrogenase (short-subunit alcohol dehydrogenase family)